MSESLGRVPQLQVLRSRFTEVEYVAINPDGATSVVSNGQRLARHEVVEDWLDDHAFSRVPSPDFIGSAKVVEGAVRLDGVVKTVMTEPYNFRRFFLNAALFSLTEEEMLLKATERNLSDLPYPRDNAKRLIQIQIKRARSAGIAEPQIIVPESGFVQYFNPGTDTFIDR